MITDWSFFTCRKYDEKMATYDFASLISTTQDMDTVSLRDLILMPVMIAGARGGGVRGWGIALKLYAGY